MEHKYDWFLKTYDELNEVIHSTDEFRIIRSAGTLRQWLVDDVLVHQVNREHRLPLQFRICGSAQRKHAISLKPVFYSALGGIHSDGPFGHEFSDIGLDGFLATVVVVADGNHITILDLIRNAAHVQGGVHIDSPKTDKDKSILKYKQNLSLAGKPFDTLQLKAVIKVVLDAISPLAEKVRASH